MNRRKFLSALPAVPMAAMAIPAPRLNNEPNPKWPIPSVKPEPKVLAMPALLCAKCGMYLAASGPKEHPATLREATCFNPTCLNYNRVLIVTLSELRAHYL